MSREEDKTRLDPDDARFAAKLGELYAPEPQTPEQRMAFARELEARLERPRHRSVWLPALAGLGAAAAMAWMVLSPAPDSVPAVESSRVAAADNRDELEWQLFYPDQLLEGHMAAASERRDGGLPDEYMAIASVFLDD
jgi:hypothetical protein